MSLLAAAVHNNATWCDAVCRALGCDTARVDGLWINRSPAPPYYSNAVALEPVDVAGQLSRVRSMLEWPIPRPWTIKDSFRRLDLAALGFEVLFDADWTPFPPIDEVRDLAIGGPTWVPMSRDADLVAWEEAWRARNPEVAAAGVARLFQPALLDDRDIRFLAGMRAGRIVAVVIANRSDDGTAARRGYLQHRADGWRPVRLIGPGSSSRYGMRSRVYRWWGYEPGDDLAAMQGLGFRPLDRCGCG